MYILNNNSPIFCERLKQIAHVQFYRPVFQPLQVKKSYQDTYFNP